MHGVTAVLEVNKDVGAWLLRQESIFWCLAEVKLIVQTVIAMSSSIMHLMITIVIALLSSSRI